MSIKLEENSQATRHTSSRPLITLLAGLLVACGGDDLAAAPPTSDRPSTVPGPGTPTGPAPSGQVTCGSGALFAAREKFNIYRVQANATHVYFGALEPGIWRVPVGGGEAVRVAEKSSAFWTHGDGLLVYDADAKTFNTMPAEGGAFTPIFTINDPALSGAIYGLNCRTCELHREGDLIYGAAKTSAGTSIVAFDLVKQTTTVVVTSPTGLNGVVKAGGNYFYGIGGTGDADQDALFMVSAAGGTPTPILPELTGSPVMGDEGTFYFAGGPRGQKLIRRFYRIPAAGVGTPELLVPGQVVLVGQSAANERGHVVMVDSGAYFIPRAPGGAPSLLPCQGLPSVFTVLGLNADSAFLYFNPAAKPNLLSTIGRVPLP